MRGIVQEPLGLSYQPNFISQAHERQILDFLESLEFEPVVMHGQTARRSVRHFGHRYNYGSRNLGPATNMPSELMPLLKQAENYAALRGQISEALINKYPRRATVGWHTDASAYDVVVGISLGSPAIIQFQTGEGPERKVYERLLNPRSVYIMRGAVREVWQHKIAPTKDLRYSITFRSLK